MGECRLSGGVMLLSTVVLVSLWVPVVHPEMFTALANMEQVLHAEHNIAHDLKKYIGEEEERLNRLRNLANNFEAHSTEALKNPELHLGNPVNAFLLVKRFTTDWEDVVTSLIRTNSSEAFLEQLSTRTCYFPDNDDLSGAATALLRLQDTYALPTSTIAQGDLKGITDSPVLTALDCFELGKSAYNQGDYYHTILWMEQSLTTLAEEDPKTVDKSATLDYYSYSVYMQGNIHHALKLTDELLAIDPGHVRAQNNKKFYERMISEEEEQEAKGDEGDASTVTITKEFRNERIRDEYRQTEEFQTYEALCRGEKTHKYKHANKLTCQYRRHHPIFYLIPLKEEVMYLKPLVLIYHHVLTDAEIAKVKELAAPRLARATVQNPVTGVLETANYRVSKSAWLKDEEDKLIQRISRKANILSNLTLNTVEELQVLNYGIGGHYEPHYDFARKREKMTFEEWRGNRIATVIYYPEEKTTFDDDQGNRIATVIYYMTDVPAGGSTVFPAIGVKLDPEKGTCAVWYNLLRNGEGDYDTRHAACPVLSGSKWICNKWFHERGQELVRPCALSPED